MNALIKKTTRADQKLAKLSLSIIGGSQLTKGKGGSYAKIKLQERGQFLRIPEKALHLLLAILNHMAEGKSVTLIPSDTEISTQQAADLLNISRPHLIKLLERGEIPYKTVGTHRRIELKNLINYEKKLKNKRKDRLDFLAAQAQDLKLGY